MKRLRCVLAVLTLAALTQACAPLQQAPLVYSSKQSLGVDFSTATTEQPGLALNLGFKSVDAAYVPVAVAKACDANVDSKTTCGGDNYRLREIKGNRHTNDSSNSSTSLDEARVIVQGFADASAAKKAADVAVAAAESDREKLSDPLKTATTAAATALQAFNDATKNQPANPTPEAAQALANIAETRKTTADEAARLQALLTNADAKIAKAREKAKETQAKLDQMPLTKIADALKIVVTENSQRQDAYSVFGSFSANTSFGTSTTASAASTSSSGNAVAATAGVNLGKIFSTGVASQNLTEGIRDYYARSAAASESPQTTYTNCMSAVSASLKIRGLVEPKDPLTTEQKKAVEAAYERCYIAEAKAAPAQSK
jgi:hypothetical protein